MTTEKDFVSIRKFRRNKEQKSENRLKKKKENIRHFFHEKELKKYFFKVFPKQSYLQGVIVVNCNLNARKQLTSCVHACLVVSVMSDSLQP